MLISPLKVLSPLGGSSGSRWTPQYKTIYKAITGTKPSQSVANAQNAFVKYLLGGNSDSRNTWDKMSCIIPYFAGMPTADDACIWWNNPVRKGVLSTTPPTYVVGKGFTGNGSSAYINTTFNPAVDGGSLFTRNNASAGWMFMNNRITTELSGSGIGTAVGDVGGCQIVPLYSTGVGYLRINNAYQAFDNISTRYLFTLVRKSATLNNLFKNRIPLVSDVTKDSTLLNNRESYSLAINQDGVATSFQTDTIGIEFKGSLLDQTDLNVMCDAIDLLINALASAISLVNYSADGQTIDTGIWTVSNPDPLSVTFSQDNALTMKTFNLLASSAVSNNIKTTLNITHGIISGSLLDIPMGESIYRGLLISLGANSIRLIRTLGALGNLMFIIYKGSNLYLVDTLEFDFIRFKIKYTITGSISFWKWVNDVWVQIGTTQNSFDIGGTINDFLMSSYASDSNTFPETYLRDVIITQHDFNTLTP